MRKWIIVLLALVGIGVLAYVFLRPKDNSIAYHKREYLAAVYGRGWMNRVRQIIRDPTQFKVRADRVRFHLSALVELGYLEDRTLVVSNRSAQAIAAAVRQQPFYDGPLPDSTFRILRAEGSNLVRIIAVKKDVPVWAQLVRDYDIPE